MLCKDCQTKRASVKQEAQKTAQEQFMCPTCRAKSAKVASKPATKAASVKKPVAQSKTAAVRNLENFLGTGESDSLRAVTKALR
jgi:protein-arginine kinase activator protein McsA